MIINSPVIGAFLFMITQELSSEKNQFYRLVVSTSEGNFTFSSESWDKGKIGNFKLSYKSAEGENTESIFYSSYTKNHLNSINSNKYLVWNLKIDSEIDSDLDYCKVRLNYTSPIIPLSRRTIIFEHSRKGGLLLEVHDSSIFNSKKQFFVNDEYTKYIKGLNYDKVDMDDLPIGIYKLVHTYSKNKLQFNMKYDE